MTADTGSKILKSIIAALFPGAVHDYFPKPSDKIIRKGTEFTGPINYKGGVRFLESSHVFTMDDIVQKVISKREAVIMTKNDDDLQTLVY